MFNVYMDDNRIGPRDADVFDIVENWHQWVICRSVEQVQELLLAGLVNNLSLDHDMGSGRPTGSDLMRWMTNNNVMPKGKIEFHSANPCGREEMQSLLQSWKKVQKINERPVVSKAEKKEEQRQ